MIEDWNSSFATRANKQSRACVGCEHVQDIVVRVSEERATSFVVKLGDQIQQHLPDSAQTFLGARNQQEQQQKTGEQVAHAAQDRERDGPFDNMNYRNSCL